MSEKEKKAKKVDAAIEAFRTERLRWIVGLSSSGSKASEKEKYATLSETVTGDEIERQMLLTELRRKGPMTIGDLSQATGIDRGVVLKHMIALRRTRGIMEVGERDNEYLYTVS